MVEQLPVAKIYTAAAGQDARQSGVLLGFEKAGRRLGETLAVQV